jgi:hypothetical protein
MKDRLPNIYRGAALAGSLALAGCAGSGAGAEPIQDVSYRNSDYKIVAGSLASGWSNTRIRLLYRQTTKC